MAMIITIGIVNMIIIAVRVVFPILLNRRKKKRRKKTSETHWQ